MSYPGHHPMYGGGYAFPGDYGGRHFSPPHGPRGYHQHFRSPRGGSRGGSRGGRPPSSRPFPGRGISRDLRDRLSAPPSDVNGTQSRYEEDLRERLSSPSSHSNVHNENFGPQHDRIRVSFPTTSEVKASSERNGFIPTRRASLDTREEDEPSKRHLSPLDKSRLESAISPPNEDVKPPYAPLGRGSTPTTSAVRTSDEINDIPPPSSDFVTKLASIYKQGDEHRKRHLSAPDKSLPLKVARMNSDNVADVTEIASPKPEATPTPAPTKPSKPSVDLKCLLCPHRQPFKQETEFLEHLTLIHYRDQLLSKSKSNTCPRCPFAPAKVYSKEARVDELLLHMGAHERMAHECYAEDLRLKAAASVTSTEDAGEVMCLLCRSVHENERQLVRHLSKRHFCKELCDSLPKKPPFVCPHADCGQVKTNAHMLMIHFGCDHNHAMDLYNKNLGMTPTQSTVVVPASLGLAPKQSTAVPTISSLSGASIQTTSLKSTQTTSLKSAQTTSLKPAQTTSLKPVAAPATFEASPLTGRQKLVQKWEKTSIEGQRQEQKLKETTAKLDKMKEEMEKMKQEHIEALKNKSQSFEKWIAQKEDALEREQKAKMELNHKLELAMVNNAEITKQLEQAKETIRRDLEDNVKIKAEADLRAEADRKSAEESLANAGETISRLQKMLTESNEKMGDLTSRFETSETTREALLQSQTERERDLKEAVEKHNDFRSEAEKKMTRQDRQIESLNVKVEKFTQEKKEKGLALQEITKKAKELEAKNNQLEKQAAKANGKKEQKAATLTAHEKQMEQLRTEKNNLQDLLENIERQLNDYETKFKDKNEELKSKSVQLADMETNLEGALAKIETLKRVEQERKEQARQLKQLQQASKDWENRQLNSVKLISAHEKEKADLETRVKRLEESHKSDESSLRERNARIEGLTSEISCLQSAYECQEREKAKVDARLSARDRELASAREDVARTEEQVRTLEQDLRASSEQAQKNQGESRDMADLKFEKQNLQEEVLHLRDSLNKKKKELNEERKRSADLRSEMRLTKERTSSLESEYSNLVVTHESLRSAHREANEKLKAFETSQETEKGALGANPLDSPVVKLENDEQYVGLSNSVSNVSAQRVDVSTQQIVNMNVAVTAAFPDEAARNVFCFVPSSAVRFPQQPVPQQLLGGVELMASAMNVEPVLLPFAASGVRRPRQKSTVAKRKKGLVDVTGDYEERGEVCSICHAYDPPDHAVVAHSPNTEWVGCDCGAWYHKACTNLADINNQFSCMALKRKCQTA